MTHVPLIDSHCHLDYLQRDGQNIDAVIDQAVRAGVALFLTISTKLSEFDVVRAIAEGEPRIYCSVGVHPHEAQQEGSDVSVERLIHLANHPKVVAIGETGLDYYYENSPKDSQISCFRAHIDAARQTGLPLIVHTRDADDDTMAILQEEYEKGPFSGLIHCFSTSKAMAEMAIEIGFKISLSGIITFKSAQALRDIVANLSMADLLVETDSPYLAPVPYRGKKNTPAFLPHTAEKLAEIQQTSIEEVSRITTENFYQLFSKVPKARVEIS